MYTNCKLEASKKPVKSKEGFMNRKFNYSLKVRKAEVKNSLFDKYAY